MYLINLIYPKLYIFFKNYALNEKIAFYTFHLLLHVEYPRGDYSRLSVELTKLKYTWWIFKLSILSETEALMKKFYFFFSTRFFR